MCERKTGGEPMSEKFVSEPIKPVAGTFDAAGMTRGEPGLPGQFVWRDKEYTVADVIEVWKETGPCKSGAPEQYLRKHWYRIRTEDGLEMTLYFERQARSKTQSRVRWWLYTIDRKGKR
ncbi:MAG: hypothetical protein A2Z25_05490 [Planctomycetes bacterium RBG_16_55_9]|nr:MAG: hypothetical protein A2Z25_05490 [Planctomycetes bacterium RBG_16_55_9]